MVASIEHRGAYRPEIDGLRAIAVASVVLHHVNREWLPGGYVGVDIFFVISGFLITSIIHRDLAAGTFSLGDFYLRRVRRIMPALLVVTAATLAAGMLLLLPDALERLSRSALYAVFSAANIYFWRFLDDGYFAESSDQEPLLHLWSLGVEEQFYLAWPLLLVLLAGVGRRRVGVAVLAAAAVGVASFTLAEATNASSPKFAYFMLPTRAGELMVGALLALVLERLQPMRGASALLAEGVGLAGMAMIGWSLVALDDLTPFPGLNALYPCLGAGMIILGGSRSKVLQWLLANRAAVGLGLISYSLYLWHWPILAFLRYFFASIAGVHIGVALLAMLVLSLATYRFVERPARRVRWTGWRQVVVLFVLPALLVSLAAGYAVATAGLKTRIESSDRLRRLEAATAPAFEFDENCQISKRVPGILSDPRCLIGYASAAGDAPQILLWGDSHAAHHVGVLDVLGKHGGLRIRNASHSSCPPVFDASSPFAKYEESCLWFQREVRAQIGDGRFNVVVLGAAWSTYEDMPDFEPKLLATIEEIIDGGARVVLLGRVPVQSDYNRQCSQRWIRINGTGCGEPTVRNRRMAFNERLAALQDRDPAIAYLEVGSAICDPERCPSHLDGLPIYFDKSHLSMRGSARVGEHLIATGRADAWLAALSGGAWRSNGQGDGASQVPPVPLPVAAEDGIDRRMFAGLALRVPFQVISDSEIEQDGSRLRKIVVGFERADSRALARQLDRQLVAAGFRRIGMRRVKGGQRFNFRAEDDVRFTLLVLPRSHSEPADSASTGSLELVIARPARGR